MNETFLEPLSFQWTYTRTCQISTLITPVPPQPIIRVNTRHLYQMDRWLWELEMEPIPVPLSTIHRMDRWIRRARQEWVPWGHCLHRRRIIHFIMLVWDVIFQNLLILKMIWSSARTYPSNTQPIVRLWKNSMLIRQWVFRQRLKRRIWTITSITHSRLVWPRRGWRNH